MKIKIFIFVLLASFILNPAFADNIVSIRFHDINLQFSLSSKGTPQYQVDYGSKTVIKTSSLGFELLNGTDLTKGFIIIQFDTSSCNETWSPVWGEVSKIQNNYKQITAHLLQTKSGLVLDIVFRVFKDGVGFRYEFPKQPGLKYFIVKDEFTQFNLVGNHKTFWIPGDYDTNEYPYTESLFSEIDSKDMMENSGDIMVRSVKEYSSVQTPLMMKSADGIYINIHEAALINYPAMQLMVNKNNFQLSSQLVPDAVGNKAYLQTPFTTPWRTIIVSNNAADILTSKIILNLNEPSKISNTSWIKPMKYLGVWWEMQTGKGTWSYTNNLDSLDVNGKNIPHNKHSANTNNVRRYIDFAAKNGIQGVLVEGWNVGWEDCCGNWKDTIFDFVTPYPDFDVNALMNYAKSKGVKMIMHNETGSAASNYDRQIDTAFKFMKQFNYDAVKTGYVGKIIPRGEFHDGQWMINHYISTVKKALDYGIMINVHEAVRPTGLHRTYPNWLACESARGNEFFAFSNGNPINHETILPFTRLMGGPMDYTPGIFKLKHYSDDSTRAFRSTLAKQLALYVTMYSPLQMAPDLPENYEKHLDAFQFIIDVPVDWDDTKILAAEPGDYLVTARKEKGTENWFIGAITDENARDIYVNFSFLTKGKKYIATVYADDENSDWQNNPERYVIKKITINSNSKIKLRLSKGGGSAISIFCK